MKQTDTGPDTGLRTVAAAVGGRVETAMRADLSAALAGADPLLSEVLEYALFSGGKRIRPLLTVLCSRCCGRDDPDLYLLAAAFEYLHVASLIHDDVIDRAEQRRGRATVLARFGMTSAILAGDWLHAQCMNLIGRLAGSEGLDIFCRATTSMVNGEFAQLRLISDTTAGEGPYFAVIRQKTGNLIASTCALGRSMPVRTPVGARRSPPMATTSAPPSRWSTTCWIFLGTNSPPEKKPGTISLKARSPCPCCTPSPGPAETSGGKWNASCALTAPGRRPLRACGH